MNIEIANRLLKLRRQFNLSQEEFAEKLGISRQAVSKWERAEASPDTDNLIMPAKIYGVSLDELLLSRDGDVKTVGPEKAANGDKGTIHADIAETKGDELGISGGGIYMHSSDGDSVSIGPDGVRISENKTGFSVNTGAGTAKGSLGAYMRSRARAFYLFPYYMIAVISFFLWGFLGVEWHIVWLLFLTIPIYYTLVSAFRRCD